ncbi:MAG TPA: Cro/Cl family transcriptional regulator, partial [Rhodobacter sp.]|nr:Cro/Cl family transcriptional regulator [Rhodobacter sp.]
MANQKLYAGIKLRELRNRLRLTQKEFGQKLHISLPYLNQMENNHRPLSASVVLALASEFGFDITEFTLGESERIVTDMREALADPLFTTQPPLADLRLAASNAPALLRAFLDLHAAYRQSHERLASLDEALGRDEGAVRPSAWEEVRDFFHYCDNYIDAVDRAAESFSTDAGPDTDVVQAAIQALGDLGIQVRSKDDVPLRTLDSQGQELILSRRAPVATQRFQTLVQLALSIQGPLIEATLDLARFHSDAAREIAKIGLANYFAGATLMPYGRFLAAAKETRHDLERLADLFGASLEQVAHRLSTL